MITPPQSEKNRCSVAPTADDDDDDAAVVAEAEAEVLAEAKPTALAARDVDDASGVVVPAAAATVVVPTRPAALGDGDGGSLSLAIHIRCWTISVFPAPLAPTTTTFTCARTALWSRDTAGHPCLGPPLSPGADDEASYDDGRPSCGPLLRPSV